jgi:tetratricopeptide (TPR) repeat protein
MVINVKSNVKNKPAALDVYMLGGLIVNSYLVLIRNTGVIIIMGYFNEANDCYNEQNYEKAISIYNKAMKDKNYEICFMHNMALCYIELKQYNRAIPLLKIAATKNPQGKYFFNLAYAYLMVENYKKALIYFNTAWSLSPDDKACEREINNILKTYRKRRNK